MAFLEVPGMRWKPILVSALVALFVYASTTAVRTQIVPAAHDPGVRGGAAAAGNPIAGLTPGQAQFFAAGKDEFIEPDAVADGLGPRFNLDSCGGCHAQPAIGGSSPALNPEVA